MLQTDRRHDPYPFTWEIPVALLAATMLAAALGIQTGRSLAHWATGAGWHWPTPRGLLTSIPAILSGHPVAGLDPPPSPAATAGAVIGWIIATETLLLLGLATLAALALRRWGPARMRGVASPAEAASTLGLRRLRAHRRIIRPDLYPPRTSRRTP